MAHKITVIGGVNADVAGTPLSKLNMRDSNPGIITVKPGGVGRNIAHNLCLLGEDVSLVGAFGDDIYGKFIAENCYKTGIDLSLSKTVKNGRSSCYLYVADEDGDMHVGISDMDIVNEIHPQYLALVIDKINVSDAVVIDANLREDAIDFILNNVKVPVFADPVSTAKAVKLKKDMGKLEMIKPNIMEAQLMTGKKTYEECAEDIIRKGTGSVFISLGKEGIYAASQEETCLAGAIPTEMVNATGAGDAAVAAIVYGMLNGYTLRKTAELAVKAGARTVACSETNDPDLEVILR